MYSLSYVCRRLVYASLSYTHSRKIEMGDNNEIDHIRLLTKVKLHSKSIQPCIHDVGKISTDSLDWLIYLERIELSLQWVFATIKQGITLWVKMVRMTSGSALSNISYMLRATPSCTVLILIRFFKKYWYLISKFEHRVSFLVRFQSYVGTPQIHTKIHRWK